MPFSYKQALIPIKKEPNLNQFEPKRNKKEYLPLPHESKNDGITKSYYFLDHDK